MDENREILRNADLGRKTSSGLGENPRGENLSKNLERRGETGTPRNGGKRKGLFS